MTIDPRDKLLQIEREMNATFAEREREIHGLLVALVAREHVLLLGPAGTAKSALAQCICHAIDGAQYFQHLLTRFSPPEEVFGPISLEGLKHDRFRRVTTRMLPEAHVAFLDEIFKSNAAVLNSLLTAINERAFDNDGRRDSIPLQTMVGASNELPEGPELTALYDRFMLRFWTSYTSSPESFFRLIMGAEPSISTRLSLDELAAAQDRAASLTIGRGAAEELFKLRTELAKDGIVASDRRWRKAVRVLRARAWLDGDTEVTPESFPILAHALWDTTDQIAQIQKKVSKYTSAELADAQQCADAVLSIAAAMPSKDTKEFVQKVATITQELKKAKVKLDALAEKCAGSQSKTKIERLAAEVNAKYTLLKNEARAALDL